MTREIKFRAWDKKRKEFIYIHLLQGAIGVTKWMESGDDAEEVQQYTGLKDKNGKDIYEGDIVKNDNEYYPINPVIYFSDIENYHDGDYDEWYCGFCLDDVWHTPLSDEVEIIGNIYENPELL